MSNKFKDLLAQARERHAETEDASPEPGKTATALSISSEISAPETAATQQSAAPKAAAPRAPRPKKTTKPNSSSIAAPADNAPKKRGRPSGKRSHPDYAQISAYISKRTHREVKIALLNQGEGREFSELVETLLDQWLRDQ